MGTEILWLETVSKDEDWLLDICGKTTVNKYNGTAFFSQLIALNFTEFETKGGKEVVVISNAG